jgi:small-conductance mechanosensitive channel
VDWTALALAALAALLLAGLGAWLITRLVGVALARIAGRTVDTHLAIVTFPLRVVSAATLLVFFQLLLFPALEVAGLQPRGSGRLGPLAAWLTTSGVKVLLIAIVAYALIHALGLVVRRFEADLARETTLSAIERGKRARTLGSVVTKLMTALIAGIAGLMILKEFAIDITPVLTGAGILGLAVGFGAQTLVRDIISGFFLILEDQLRVGDVASINGKEGLIEELNLRTVVLRDGEGTVHVFPNGAITTLANRSRDYSYCVIDLHTSYRDDPDRVADIVREVGREVKSDPAFAPFILDPIEVLGVDGFTDWAVTTKFRIKTVPLKQGDVGRELRKRLKKALDYHGIAMPFPERVVTVRESAAVSKHAALS